MSASQWASFAKVLDDTKRGIDRTSKECAIRAVGIDPNIASAWNELGISHGGYVSVPKKHCFILAAALNPAKAKYWFNMGLNCGDAGALRYSKKDCMVETIKIDPDYKKAWKELAKLGGTEEFTKEECEKKAN